MRTRLLSVAVAVTVAATAVVALPVTTSAAPDKWSPAAEKPVRGHNAITEPLTPSVAEQHAVKTTPEVVWPAPGVVTGRQAHAKGTAQVEVLDRRLDGPIMRLNAARPDAMPVEVDYSGYRNAYGGDWANRLRLATLPECALTTPDRDECQPRPVPTRNDGSGVLSGDVTPGLFAVTAAASSGAGDLSAAGVSPGATWVAGGSSGDFSWQYGMPAPPSLTGPHPTLNLAYSSGGVDARTSATNNQPSWVGEGFEFEPGGYVERRYAGCSTDMKGSNTTKKTGDLCWRTDNAVLALNGGVIELVRDDKTGAWRPRADDGSKIDRLVGKENADDNGEAWRVTTKDGTQYFFGLNKLPGWTGTSHPVTNSVWTVPVFGNQKDEPCNKSTFDASVCDQAWRWNLDYVVDARGNTMSYFYKTEINHYSRNMTATKASDYVRGGYLDRIEYGQKDNEVYTKPAVGKVQFTAGDRCVPNTDCVTSKPANWPDTPLDQQCNSTTNCGTKYSPTFWTQKRLVKITTSVWNGSAFRDVDSWSFRHTFQAPGDGTRAGLWLAGLQHKGLAGAEIAMPETTFDGVQMPNRVDGIEGIPPMNWWRVSKIRTETGSELTATYMPADCAAPANLPRPDNNTKRCQPLKWTPDSLDDQAKERNDWFNKYVVAEVAEKDRLANAAIERTQIEYQGPPAWHGDDADGLVPAERKTWSQWRGYQRVKTLRGQPGKPREQVETLFYRGMDKDKTASGERRVQIVDSTNIAKDDTNDLAGTERERIEYAGEGGQVSRRVITDPWVSTPTATRVRSWGTTTAVKVGEARVRSFEDFTPARNRQNSTENSYDASGRVVSTTDLKDLADPGDDTCTRYLYPQQAGPKGITDMPYQKEVVGVACDKQPSLPDDLIALTRMYFDGNETLGAPPVAGLITRQDEVAGWESGAPKFRSTHSVYDSYGRAVESYDVYGKKTTFAYEPAVGGPVTKVTTTNSLGHQGVTELDPSRGQPRVVTDPTGKRTETDHDSLGRVIRVWQPGRSRSQPPSVEHSYIVDPAGSNAVATRTLQADGGYVTDYDIFDSQMRERQNQRAAPGGGRIVTDTIRDALGQVIKQNGPYVNDAPPSPTVLIAHDETELPAQTVTEYDGQGRLVSEAFNVHGIEKSRTTHTYGEDRHDIDPPDGDTPTTEIVDGAGQVVEKREYKGGSPTGAYDSTTYSYTKFGQVKAVTDAAGNVWQHEYDLLGRQTKAVDPDRGVTEYGYDIGDRLVSRKDGRGAVLAYAYDDTGRATAVHDGSLTGPKRVEFGYDVLPDGKRVNGLRVSATRYVNGNAYSSSAQSYDAAFNVTSMTVSIPPVEGKLAGSYKFSSVFAPDGSVIQTTLPAMASLAEETLTYTYDNLGLPTTLSGKTSYVTNAAYTPYSEPKLLRFSTGGKAVEQTQEYEPGTRRLKRAQTTRETGPAVVSDVKYDYDPAGNITKVANEADGGDTQCFTNDYLRRLTAAWTPADGNCAAAPAAARLGGPAPYWLSWTYDKIGNRLSETSTTPAGKSTSSVYEYPQAGQPQPHGVRKVTTDSTVDRYGYDAGGNTTARKGQTLEWDAEGMIAKVTEGDKVTSFVHDANGDRLIRRDNTGTTLYLGATELKLTPSGVVVPTRHYSFGDDVIAVRTPDGKLNWLESNNVNTATTSIDADTQEAQRRRMTPFGTERGAKPAAWPGEKGYVGGTTDTSTGLTQLGKRQYDPATGRFVSPDPVIDYDSSTRVNAYSYANNSPVTFSDPDGLDWTDLPVVKQVKKYVVQPVWKRVIKPVVTTTYRTVKKYVWNPIAGFLSGLFGLIGGYLKAIFVRVLQLVIRMIPQTIRTWVRKTVIHTVRSVHRVWRAGVSKARDAGKQLVRHYRQAGKWIQKHNPIKRADSNDDDGDGKGDDGDDEPLERGQVLPTTVYSAGGGTYKPRVGDKREGQDYELENGKVKDQSTAPVPLGKSGFKTLEDLKNAGLNGWVYVLPAGYKLPDGLGYILDGAEYRNGYRKRGHVTIYATDDMPLEKFQRLIQGMPWRKATKVK